MINAGGGTLNLSGGIAKNGTTLTIGGGGIVNITTNGITGSMANSDLVGDGTTVVLSVANSYNGRPRCRTMAYSNWERAMCFRICRRLR